MINYIIKENEDSMLLKDIAKKKMMLSSRLFNKLKLNHHIYINNRIAFANDIVKKGDIITINFDYAEDNSIEAQNAQIDILYEDDWYLAVNKPAGIVVHPCSYHPNSTLSNYVKYYLNTNKMIRPINRLDKDTSGIVLFAKNEYAQERFNSIHNSINKFYIAIVDGWFDKDEGKISAPISRKEASIIERKVDFENGQESITLYKVLKNLIINELKCSIVEFQLLTGRTHQIRVHSAYINHPIIGDTLYNKKQSANLMNRQALHSYKLEFKHPITKDSIKIVTKIPDDIKTIIEKEIEES